MMRGLPVEVRDRLRSAGVDVLLSWRRDGRTLEDVEQRSADIPLVDVERRADISEPLPTGIVGYATIYGAEYDIYGGPDAGGWTEVVAPGAGARTAKTGDIRLMLNHGDGGSAPMARSVAGVGTLRVSSDETGLRYEARGLDLRNPRVAEMMSAISRGDLTESSFAFQVIRQSWSPDYTLRTIEEFRALDVSPVTYPANAAASVSVASASCGDVARGLSVVDAERLLQI